MGDRAFTIERIEHGDGLIGAAKIECCDCSSVAYSVNKPGLSPKAHEQHFRNHGWFIGNGPRRDKCPDCQRRKKPVLKVVEPAVEVKPREMTRDERLIIMDKIRDVHDGDRYSSGWTDKRIGEDLGVPKAWVEDIRLNVLQFVGAHNEMFEEFLEKAAPIIADMKNMANSARVQLEQVKAIEGRIADLERLGRKVEKEIGR